MKNQTISANAFSGLTSEPSCTFTRVRKMLGDTELYSPKNTPVQLIDIVPTDEEDFESFANEFVHRHEPKQLSVNLARKEEPFYQRKRSALREILNSEKQN